MTARDRILAKLRAAAPVQTSPSPDVAGYYGAHPLPPLAGRVAEFKAQLTAAHAEVVVADEASWMHRLAEIIMVKAIRRLLADWQGEAGRALARALPAGIRMIEFDRPIEQWKAELFEKIDAGFSVANAAVAATGTLVFASGPDAPRTVSLVPPVHLVLVRAETIYADMHSAAVGEAWAQAMPTNLIMVSGPSKTADIQQTLAYGAHGPKQLVVVVVIPDGVRP